MARTVTVNVPGGNSYEVLARDDFVPHDVERIMTSAETGRDDLWCYWTLFNGYKWFHIRFVHWVFEQQENSQPVAVIEPTMKGLTFSFDCRDKVRERLLEWLRQTE